MLKRMLVFVVAGFLIFGLTAGAHAQKGAGGRGLGGLFRSRSGPPRSSPSRGFGNAFGRAVVNGLSARPNPWTPHPQTTHPTGRGFDGGGTGYGLTYQGGSYGGGRTGYGSTYQDSSSHGGSATASSGSAPHIGLILLCLAINVAISFWNARVAGKSWVESKIRGGFPRFMAWMVAGQSALGFALCYVIVFCYALYGLGWIAGDLAWMVMLLGYLVLMPGLLISGLAITLESWAIAYRNRGIANFGLAAYNTYAQLSGMYCAARSAGAALDAVSSFFAGVGESNAGTSGDPNKRKNDAFAALLIVLLATLAGIATTAIIIRRYAGSEPLPPWEYLKAQQARDTYRQEL